MKWTRLPSPYKKNVYFDWEFQNIHFKLFMKYYWKNVTFYIEIFKRDNSTFHIEIFKR